MSRDLDFDAGMPLLVGEAPSKAGDRYHAFPLSGPPARVLCTLAGIPPQDGGTTYGRWTWALYERFSCINVLERYPGGHGRGASFPLPAAREAVAELRPALPAVVVLLGRRVAQAFDVGEPFYEWTTTPRASTPPWDDPGVEWVCEEHAPLPFEHDGCGCAGMPRRDGEDVPSPPAPARVAVIPHPSGLNRTLNDDGARVATGGVLREALRLAVELAPA